MKAVVLGGGLTGRCAVRDLIENQKVTEIVVGDIDKQRLENFVTDLKTNKVKAETVDVRNHEATARILKDADVVLNAVQYYFNIDVMKAALMARTHYLDLGGLFHTTKKQLELDTEFRKADITAVVGMGGVPGMSNVMARWAVDHLDSVDTIRVRDGWRDFTPNAPRFVVTWSIQTFADEFTLPAMVFENGEYKQVPPLTLPEFLILPSPIGEVEVFTTLHSEIATFPSSFKDKGVKNVNWKEGSLKGWQHDYELLVALGLTSQDKLQFEGTQISPRQFLLRLLANRNLLGHPEAIVPEDWECSRVDVLGKKSGKFMELQLDVLYSAKREWKMSCAQYGVGVPASIVAQMLGNDHIEKKGVLPPENCINPTDFFNELAKRNMPVSIRGPSELIP
ncbi:MAG TPA: saccharopine dehydrogenase C-terminal domain-containing protein [Candidatus Bathyarchaeia archaeon]|nr:saccharopine dehydrogenase C-terminal domain-containing protein [Candidatus Bathyarchaeia archaeon]